MNNDENTVFGGQQTQTNDENTVFDSPTTGAATQEPTTSEKEPSKPSTLKRSVAAGVGGMAVGAGAVYAANHLKSDDPKADTGNETDDTDDKNTVIGEDIEEENIDQPVTNEDGEAPVELNINVNVDMPGAAAHGAAAPAFTGAHATSVNDEMSFNEAFAAARAEVGPGGVFEWHGHSYNTYYAEEVQTVQVKQPVEVTVNEDPTNEVPEIEVLGVVHDDETGYNVGAVNIDGTDAVVIDVDGDMQFDILAIDLNNVPQDNVPTDDNLIEAGAPVIVDDLNIGLDDMSENVTPDTYEI